MIANYHQLLTKLDSNKTTMLMKKEIMIHMAEIIAIMKTSTDIRTLIVDIQMKEIDTVKAGQDQDLMDVIHLIERIQ